MGATRRKFTLEFKTEAAHRVIDTGRTIAEVAAELCERLLVHLLNRQAVPIGPVDEVLRRSQISARGNGGAVPTTDRRGDAPLLRDEQFD